MTIEIKPPALLMASLVLVFTALIGILLWLIPGDRQPFDYMVAGTFATAITLIILFVFALRRRW